MNKKELWLLTAISLGSMIGFLDIAGVNTLLSAIQKSFSASITQLQWVMNSYLLFYCVFLTIMGKLCDLFGAKRIHFLAVFLYGLTSLAAALSPNIYWLIGSRFVQGIAMAMLIPSALTLIANKMPESQEKALGFWSAITGFGLAFGPLIAGLFVAYFSWRGLFYINVPIALISLIIFSITLKGEKPTKKREWIDWKGFILIFLSLFLFVFSIIEEQLYLLPISIILFIIFYLFEKNASDPLIHFDLFKNRIYLSMAIGYFALISCVFTALFFIPLYLHQILNKSTFQVGYLILPITLTVVLLSFFIPKITSFLTAKITILLGFFLLACSFSLQIFEQPLWILIIAYFLFGIGWGLTFSPMKNEALAVTAKNISGMASGLLLTIDSLGGTITLAIGGFLYRKMGQGLLGFQSVSLLLALIAAAAFILIFFLMKKNAYK